MRRTWNTSVSPTIGIVTAGTGNIAFGPACAAAGSLRVAAPASASAPVARMLRRSMLSMGVLLFVCWFGGVLDREIPRRNPALDLNRSNHHRTVSNDFKGLALALPLSSRLA